MAVQDPLSHEQRETDIGYPAGVVLSIVKQRLLLTTIRELRTIGSSYESERTKPTHR